MTTPYKVISFYTPAYESVAKRLIATLNRHSIDHDVERIESLGSWQRNCAHKPSFILRKSQEHSGKPIVWIDADATIQSRPVLFETLAQENSVDIAVRMSNTRPAHDWNRVMTGTIYFGASPQRSKLIRDWQFRCNTNPLRWDQVSLAHTLENRGVNGKRYKVLDLPEPYCAVFDRRTTNELPIIVHWQASRQLKDCVGDEGDQP